MRICRHQQGDRVPCEPAKVICAGRSYRSLLVEQERDVPSEPFLFLTSSTPVVGPGAEVRYPRGVGDVVLTGTSAGIRPVRKGDVIRVGIEGIGTLANTIVD